MNSKGTLGKPIPIPLTQISIEHVCVPVFSVYPCGFLCICVWVCVHVRVRLDLQAHLRMRAFVHVYIYGGFDDSSVRCVTQLDDTQYMR